MSSQQQKASRWGNFLSSVESRLDTILAEDDPKAQQRINGRPVEPAAKKETANTLPDRSPSPARPATPSKAQARLNERLARAVANKSLGKSTDGSSIHSEGPSRPESPANTTESPRPSSELQRLEVKGQTDEEESGRDEVKTALTASSEQLEGERKVLDAAAKAGEQIAAELSSPSTPAMDNRKSLESTGSNFDQNLLGAISRSQTPEQHQLQARISSAGKSQEEVANLIAQLQAEKTTTETRWKEETQDLLEKLDALQAKLLYLSKGAAEDARKAFSDAKTGTAEQKLAEKDERIALLIEEGQKLSQTELKHMTIIKKMRAKTAEDEKTATEAKKLSERADRNAKEAQERAKRAAAAEKQANDRLRGLVRLEKDLEAVKDDRDIKDRLVRDLQIQLSDLTSAAKQAEEKARLEALEQTRKRAIELEDGLASMKAEKEAAEKEHQNVLREMREKAEREKERAKVTKVERQGELSILESRLEAYRARAEEASAGQGSDIQAKMLRQIETLQNQYAVASENWQGIEGSLVSRVSALEAERDESAKREADLRRKTREINAKNRRLEEELETSSSHGHDLDAERNSLSTQLKTLREQLNRSETDLNIAKKDFEAEREQWEARQSQRMEEERAKMRDEFLKSAPSGIFTQFRTQSPGLNNMRTRRSSNAGDHSSPQSRRASAYQGLGLSNPASSHERPISRHSSLWTIEGAESKPAASQALNRTDSMSTVPNISINNGIPETPSVDYDATPAEDDFFGGVHTPTTPPERTINDLVSVSTAAGPSVQLVERMSAAVRRLESEKAAHKDEIARLVTQRDESREQVVELMRDNEGKKAVDARLEVVEKESADLKQRYETTLEMLGEESERVEELKADIVDLKAMMREMVEERVR